ncbi:hypothetical protein [uncultured Chryseobacterium sp.]|uniref:hypothetical protein n=1 Tax=uncultured Chryseobacterium sp. TaxID=259322 RepID=UPI003748EB1E
MLTAKLSEVKKEIENKPFKSDDDKKTLRLLDSLDKNINKIDNSDDFIIKSFNVTPSICPNCGKKL